MYNMLKISLVGVFMLNDSLNLYYSSPAKEYVELYAGVIGEEFKCYL